MRAKTNFSYTKKQILLILESEKKFDSNDDESTAQNEFNSIMKGQQTPDIYAFGMKSNNTNESV